MSSQTTGPVYDRFMIDIVEYFYRQQDFSPYTFLRARLAILDSLGCAIETLVQSRQCYALLGPVVPGTTVPHGCRTPGTTFTTDPVKASFDLGTLIRYLDHNDGFTGQEWGHPSDMLGAIISVAEWKSRTALASHIPDTTSGHSTGVQKSPRVEGVVTVKQVLVATIKAYEVHCLLQLQNSLNQRGFDHTLLVKVGAVCAVAWLLGMTQGECLAALSQAFQDGATLRTYRQHPNTSPRKGWAAGDACMRAVTLAFFTRAGQPGTPTVLTDSKWGFYARLFDGQEFTLPQEYGSYGIKNTGFKLVAAEGHGISACNAALIISQDLRSRGILAKSITKISIRTTKPAIIIIDKTGPLTSAADRDHCLQYMVAVTLLKGAMPEIGDYGDESVYASSAEIARLREAMHAYEDAQLTHDYLDLNRRTLAAGLTVTLDDGRVLPEVLVEAPLGHVSHPGTNAAVLAKFRANLALGFPSTVADRVIESLKDDQLPMSDLMDMLWKGHSTREAAKL